MNVNAKKWVEALRSGDYKEGIRFLNIDNSFNCYGVACELYLKENNDMEVSKYKKELPDDPSGNMGYFVQSGLVTTYDGEDRFLPNKVKKWLGLRITDSKEIYFKINGRTYGLDTSPHIGDFNEIASTIESEPNLMFEIKGKV